MPISRRAPGCRQPISSLLTCSRPAYCPPMAGHGFGKADALRRTVHLKRETERRTSLMTGLSALARRVRRLGVAVAVLVAVSGAFETIGAEVYEWTDNNGDRHFATSLDQLPDEARDKARVVVNAAPRAEEPPAANAAPNTQPNIDDSERDSLFG